MLDRQSILNAPDRTFEEMDVPEWGGKVRIGVMSGTDRDSYFNTFPPKRERTEDMDWTPFRYKLLVRCIIDENNQRIFQDDEADLLASKNTEVLERLMTVAGRINKLTETSAEETKNA